MVRNPPRTRFVNFSFPKKSVDKSGVDKSEDALYIILNIQTIIILDDVTFLTFMILKIS